MRCEKAMADKNADIKVLQRKMEERQTAKAKIEVKRREASFFLLAWHTCNAPTLPIKPFSHR